MAKETIMSIFKTWIEVHYPSPREHRRGIVLGDWLEFLRTNHYDIYMGLDSNADPDRGFNVHRFGTLTKKCGIRFFEIREQELMQGIDGMPDESFNLVQLRRAKLSEVDWEAIRNDFIKRAELFPEKHIDVDGEMFRLRRRVGL